MKPHKQPRDAGVRKAFKGIVGNRPADKFERVERHRREVDRRKRETMWADRAPEDATAARNALYKLYDPKQIAKRQGREETA